MTMTAPSRVSMRDRLRTDYQWTPRQREVLVLIARGKTNTQIGEALGISLDGAKYHVSEILSKLQADQREEAAEYWRRYNGVAPRFERIFRGITGGVAGKWVVGTATVLVAGAATAAIVAIAINQSSDEPRTSDQAGPRQPAKPDVPSAATAGVDANFSDQWGWQAPERDGYIWLRADTGKVVASYGDEGADAPPALGGGVALLHAETGQELWRFDSGGHAFPAAITPQHIVFGTADGTVYGVDVATGQEVWRLDFPGIPFQAVATGSVVIIADADPETFGPGGLVDKTRLLGRVWAVDPATGEVRWREQVGDFNAYVTYGNGAVVAATDSPSQEGTVVAFDPASGNRLWDVPSSGASGPPIIWDEQVIVAGSELTALELRSGTKSWAVKPQDGGTFSFPSVHDATVVAGVNTGAFEVRTLTDGQLQESAEMGDCVAQPLSFGDQLFVLVCGQLLRLEQGAAGVQLAAYYIPQGGIDSLAMSGNFIVLSTGTGHTPDRVQAIEPSP